MAKLFGRDEHGQSVVELALLLPIFLLLTMIAIDVGRAMSGFIAVQNAAREAAVYMAMRPTDLAGARAAATNEIGGAMPIAVALTPAGVPGAIGEAVVTATFTPLTSELVGVATPLTLRGRASMARQ